MIEFIKNFMQKIKYRYRLAKGPFFTIEPIDGRIRVYGYEKVLYRIEWDDVTEIAVFKNDDLTTDRICMAFRSNKTKEWHIIDEDMKFWDKTLTVIEKEFKLNNEKWWKQIVYPPFSTNWTIVWQQLNYGSS